MADVYIVPDDIIYNIFLRLPAKPLLRCKCLSKHWNRVILDPHFMKLRSRRMILFWSEHDLYTLDSVVQDDDNNDHSILKIPSPFENPEGKKVIIGGTFNGIVLLVFKDIILYNPFTRAFKTVPDPPFRFYYGGRDVFGFGYSTTSDDLKIVRLRKRDDCNKICCDVFSLKHGSWTTPAELIGNYIIYRHAGTFIKGFLYWTSKNIDRNTRLIVALNVKDMVFSEIQCPCFSRFDPLGTLNGRLCILSLIEDNKYGIWVMNEHGFGKSWTQLYLMPLLPRIDYQFRHMCNLDKGKVVMFKFPNQLIIYDMLKNSYKEVFEVNNSTPFGDIQPRTAIEFVETLMSPSDLCS